ncbi:PREDICTED: uncharacterized protein DDB_G0274915-like [Tinamus guttatus]|uniref:uncharacterized protein DDB_G0274915-like n=1 Tax=Tinamus guttatus TaxID=94827 RepID=UPI00052ED8FC|nr:PREDICTED: uncharacterized protein DDB_G0274915-like [Tinamus guttatus]
MPGEEHPGKHQKGAEYDKAGTTDVDVTVKTPLTFSTFSRPSETSALLLTTTSTSTATTTPSSSEVGSSTPEERSSTADVTSPYASTELSSPVTNSTPSPEVTISTTADEPATPLVCPSAATNTNASHLFLSLRLTVPLDLENSMAQELILSKLRGDLQTAFPCAGFTVAWRGKRRT